LEQFAKDWLGRWGGESDLAFYGRMVLYDGIGKWESEKKTAKE
jgi:hypothetical protein